MEDMFIRLDKLNNEDNYFEREFEMLKSFYSFEGLNEVHDYSR